VFGNYPSFRCYPVIPEWNFPKIHFPFTHLPHSRSILFTVSFVRTTSGELVNDQLIKKGVERKSSRLSRPKYILTPVSSHEGRTYGNESNHRTPVLSIELTNVLSTRIESGDGGFHPVLSHKFPCRILPQLHR